MKRWLEEEFVWFFTHTNWGYILRHAMILSLGIAGGWVIIQGLEVLG